MNTNPTTGIRYGVISFNSLDSDLGQDLWYRYGVNISERDAYAEERDTLNQDAIDLAADGELDEDAIDDHVERGLERFGDGLQIEEPTIEGEHDGVKYRISWLGGAPMLWVFEGPIGYAGALCSPCVPGAADLDWGFDIVESHETAGYKCYVVPREWLAE